MVLTNEELREKYRVFARWYDAVAGLPLALMGMNRLRRKLIKLARGRVLEVAAGTGLNLRYYDDSVTLVLSDLSEAMLAKASRRVNRRAGRTAIVQANAEQLPFQSASFDTVVSTFSLCTFPDPVAALHELGRVCKPGGRILLLEHGISRYGWFARYQYRTAEKHARLLGCHWNRLPDELVEQAGLKLIGLERSYAGIIYMIEAAVG